MNELVGNEVQAEGPKSLKKISYNLKKNQKIKKILEIKNLILDQITRSGYGGAGWQHTDISRSFKLCRHATNRMYKIMNDDPWGLSHCLSAAALYSLL